MASKSKTASKSPKSKGDEEIDKSDKNSFQLSNNRFITVSEFRNKIRVDIREFYLADDGQRKPGKKGISLSLEEWKKLQDLMPKIKSAIKGVDDDESEKSVSDSDSSD